MTQPPTFHIAFPFRQGPWGGGNRFLGDLKAIWESAGTYRKDPAQAEILLFNGHQNLEQVVDFKKRWPEKTFIHRMAGILETQRGKRGAQTDALALRVSLAIADGIIYQSQWAKSEWEKRGADKGRPSAVIANAPNPATFFEGQAPRPHTPLRVITSSWSANAAKGFSFLEYLDQHLDFSRFQIRFYGNAPIRFQHIEVIPPVPSDVLAEALKQSDVFLSTSENDACSNSLVEALHCGLVAVARNSGGHPELIGPRGLLFSDEITLLKALESVAKNYATFQKSPHPLKDLATTAQAYAEFATQVRARHTPRPLEGSSFLKARLLWEKARERASWTLRRFKLS